MFHSFNLNLTISSQTRVTKDSVTCIVNIFTNCTADLMKAETIDLKLADHYAVIAQTKCIKIIKIKKSVFMRSITKSAIENFVFLLKDFEWQSVLVKNNIQVSFKNVHDTFVYFFQICFPIKKFNLNQKNRHKPFNIYLYNLRNKLDILYELMKQKNDHSSITAYKTYKKKYFQMANNFCIYQNDQIIEKPSDKSKTIWK